MQHPIHLSDNWMEGTFMVTTQWTHWYLPWLGLALFLPVMSIPCYIRNMAKSGDLTLHGATGKYLTQ